MRRDSTSAGVDITEHKSWNTIRFKTHTGGSGRTYYHCPKWTPLDTPLVNLENQHLCGGWSYYVDDNATGLARVSERQKPAFEAGFTSTQERDAFVAENLASKLIFRPWKVADHFFVSICYDETLAEAFGLEELKELHDWYADLGHKTQILEYAQRRLIDWHEEWTDDHTEPALKGLVLGYPIEVTVSMLSLI